MPAIARLAANAGNYLGRHNLTVTKTGKGTGTVAGSPGISCGSRCTELLPFGTAISLAATPGPDSRFAGWTGACSGAGACQSSIAGSELAVAAVFELATFAGKTSVRLSPVSTRISAAAKMKIRVKNGNRFSVTGRLSGRSTGKVSVAKRRRIVTLKSKPIRVAANASQIIKLKLPAKLKRILVRKHKLRLVLIAKLQDPAGTARTVRRNVSLRLKKGKRKRHDTNTGVLSSAHSRTLSSYLK